MGTLHLVATPIGNLEDVTLRALRILGEADLVLAEDTRRTRILLDRHDVHARPLSFHAHNEAARCKHVLEVLDGGGVVALVTDAGTPLVSDPGERLVSAAVAAGHDVTPVPGASAVLSALCVAGLPVASFSFYGFLPRKAGERKTQLDTLVRRPETLVFFESPRRLAATLGQLADVFGDREACVARELTKLHEEVARGTLRELADRFADGARGEVTIVVAGAPVGQRESDGLAGEDLDAAILERVAQGDSSREIAADLAPAAGTPRREVYRRVVELRRSP